VGIPLCSGWSGGNPWALNVDGGKLEITKCSGRKNGNAHNAAI